jgi:hypothetical protein
MSDYSGSPSRLRDNATAHDAVADVDIDAALALARASARTVRALSDEANELFKVFLQREIDRLKLSGPGAPDLVVMRLREFARD